MANDLEHKEQTEFLRSWSRVAAAICAVLTVGYAGGLHLFGGAAVVGTCGAAFFALPWFARRTSLAAAGHAAAAVVFVGVAYVASLRGDVPMGALLYLCVVPLTVAWLSGRRAAIGWSTGGVALVLAVLVRFERGEARFVPELLVPEALAQKDRFEAFGLVGLLVLMTAMALGIDRRRRRVERERLRLHEELEARQAAARLGQLATGVAHEVNNPLAWMTSGVTWLESQLGQVPPGEFHTELVEVVEELREGSRRVAAIVEDLRAVARNDGLPHDGADVERVVRIVKSLGAGHLSLSTTVAPGLPRLHASEAGLAQGLLDVLLDGGAPQASLTVEPEGERVRFTVTPVRTGPSQRLRARLTSWGVTFEHEGQTLVLHVGPSR